MNLICQQLTIPLNYNKFVMEYYNADKDDGFKKVSSTEAGPAEDKPMTLDEKNYYLAMGKLKLVCSVTVLMCTCQGIGGYYANSIAIMTDTVHLATDMIGFVISMVALKISIRPANKDLSFGWHRAEILGTLLSLILLLVLTIGLLYAAI